MVIRYIIEIYKYCFSSRKNNIFYNYEEAQWHPDVTWTVEFTETR